MWATLSSSVFNETARGYEPYEKKGKGRRREREVKGKEGEMLLLPALGSVSEVP